MFTNQTIMLTGASGSLGEKLIFKLLKDKPKRFLLVGRNKNSLLNLQKTIRANKIPCELIYLDFLDPNLDDYLEGIFSYHKPTVLIQAAGYLCQQSFLHGNISEIEKEMRINYIVPIKLIDKFISHLSESTPGLVINILSLAGLVPSPTMLGYSASKSALKHFVEGLRIELTKTPTASAVRLCNVTLGLFDSSMTENIQKYKYVNSQCPSQLVDSIYSELMSGKDDIMVGLYAIGARIVNSLAPGVMRMIAEKTSPEITSDGKLV
jgi:3-oxoacyl-[acyl-carrier protein] reductase